MSREAASIKENYDHVLARIVSAAEKAGRKPSDITLVTVTKGFGVPKLIEAVEAGATDLGENRAREAAEKFETLGREISDNFVTWHIIGNLQTNKVKYVIDFADLIHSVDRFSLAEEINRRAKAIDKVQDILIEVNVSGEASKAGVGLADAADLASRVLALKNVRIKGFMAMAPISDNPEDSRPVFAKLRSFRDSIIRLPGLSGASGLSMGMTGDFEVGIEEGATIVRVGRAIMGERSKSI
jgi:PLP dependent protein